MMTPLAGLLEHRNAMNGVLCVEGTDRWPANRPSSVLPVLDAVAPYNRSHFVYRTVDAAGPMLSQIDRWLELEKYDAYPILYVSTHGEPGRVVIDADSVPLSDIADVIAGRGAGRVIHFGAC
jgi:hypothetical protein